MRININILVIITFFISYSELLAQGNTTPPAEEDGTYTGKTRGGLRHGEGTYIWKDGAIYEGDWRYNLMDGKGKMKWADGSSYNGSWRDGKRNGYGTFRWANGDKYVGMWKNDKKNGQGKLSLKDGTVHDGEWENDMANGQGVHTWASGTKYNGEWKNNQMHGQGIMVYYDKRTEMGTWKYDEYVPCKCTREVFPVQDAYNVADAVFIGAATAIIPGEDKYLVQFEVLKYWKGDLLPERTIYLRAGYSSCDILFLQDETYLVYAQDDSEGVMKTTSCSRTINLLEVTNDIDILNAEAPCKRANKDNIAYYNGNDKVCGCDGNTYRNAYQANRAGIQVWEIGECVTQESVEEKKE